MRRLTFAVEVSALLYVAAAVVGVGILFRQHSFVSGDNATNTLSVIGVIAMPAIAALLFIFSCALLPGLVAPMRLRPPLNITLPIVFCAFHYMVVNLFVLSDSQVVVLPAPIRTSEAWKDPRAMLIALFVQMFILSVAVQLSRKSSGESARYGASSKDNLV